MNSLFFKSLAIAVIGINVPLTSTAIFKAKSQNLTIKNSNPLGFANNNPVFVRDQQDGQGADTVTLTDVVNSQGFVLDYTISSATLSYFYPAIGRYISPGDQLYNLLTKGSNWYPTTHFWQPLKQVNAFDSILGSSVYSSYLSELKTALENQYSWSSDLKPSSAMATLQKAMQSGSALEIEAQVVTSGPEKVYLDSKVQTVNYPPTAQNQGVNDIFGNLNEPYNVLKVHINANSCQDIYKNCKDASALIAWLFNSQDYPASAKLNQYVNNTASTKGKKYDPQTKESVPYWTSPNFSLVQTSIQQQFSTIMQAVNHNLNTNGITLTFSRNEAGQVSMTVNSQQLAYRLNFHNDHKVLFGPENDYAFLTTREAMALRSASFRYLTDQAQPTKAATLNAQNWLLDKSPTWGNADVVHAWSLGNQLEDIAAWSVAIPRWNWTAIDKFLAAAIIQNRGVVFKLNNFYQLDIAFIAVSMQDLVIAPIMKGSK